MKVRGDFLGPPRSTDKTTLIIKVSKVAKIRNRYNQVPHLTQDTNGKVTNSQKTPQTRAKRSRDNCLNCEKITQSDCQEEKRMTKYMSFQSILLMTIFFRYE